MVGGAGKSAAASSAKSGSGSAPKSKGKKSGAKTTSSSNSKKKKAGGSSKKSSAAAKSKAASKGKGVKRKTPGGGGSKRSPSSKLRSPIGSLSNGAPPIGEPGHVDPENVYQYAGEAYPGSMKLNFNKLPASTLRKYAWHHTLGFGRVCHDDSDLAAACANHFKKAGIRSEHDIMLQFARCIRGPDYVFEKEDSSSPAKKKKKRKSASAAAAAAANIIPTGKLAAAHIEDDWLLTKVLSYVKRRRVYKVEDVDADEDGDNLQYEVHYKNICALPYGKENPDDAMSAQTKVIALYPGTSAFYPAEIVRRHDRGSGRIEYSVRFDDDEKDAKGKIKVKRVKRKNICRPDEIFATNPKAKKT